MAASINDKLKKYKSLFSTTLSTGIGTGTSDTITPATVTGLPTDTAITLTIDRVDSSGIATPSKLERIKGIISGGNLIDYVRGVDGTTEQSHTAGAVVEMVWNAADLNDIVDWGLVEHSQLGVHDKTKVVDLTTAQTLTNKTLTSPIIGGTPVLDDTSAIPFYGDSMSRQAIINGNFDVWQRGTSVTDLSSTKYTADRWTSYCANTATTISRQDGTGVSGSQYCIRLQRTVGNTETDTCTLNHGLETTNSIKFRGKKLTLSFYARAGANYSASTISSTIYSGKGTDQSPWSFTTDTNIGGVSNTITTTWTKFSVTTTDVVASDVTQLRIAFARGSSGTAGAADYCEIAQVQLCAGDVALPFMPKSFEEELRACQRYCFGIITNSSVEAVAFGHCISTTVGYVHIPTKVTMRAIPTLTSIATDWKLYPYNAGFDITVLSIDDLGFTSNNYVVLKVTVASGLSAGIPCYLGGDGTTGRVMILSAEL